jgi:hypothetical protein
MDVLDAFAAANDISAVGCRSFAAASLRRSHHTDAQNRISRGSAVRLLESLADRVLGRRVPQGELPHPVPPGVVVRRNRWIPRVGGWFMGGSRTPAGAVTFGRTILCNADHPLSDELIVHELVHVQQWQDDPLFVLKYGAEWFRHGYRENRYEKAAYARQREYAAEKRNSAPPRYV